jgi:hypothetical protein
MIPHERSLVERMSGRPFVLLGVNSDGTEDPERLARYEQQSEKLGVTWRSFRDESTRPKISTTWNVTSWPTLYLIDHRGVIVAKDLAGGPAAWAAVEAAVVRAERELARK